ncbi:MAG TPA: M13 family metallopeptidase N-terminal domain-containing protein [Nannocystis sp.]
MSTVGLEPVDTTTDPCVDLYRHACGRWLAEHPRPLASPVWARSFSAAEAQAQARVLALLDELAGAKDGVHARLGAYWRACIDEDGRIAAGYTAIEPLLRAIDDARPRDLGSVLGRLHAHGIPALFHVRPTQDPAGRTLRITLGGTGLGTPQMYAPSAPRLTAYRQHVAEMLRLAGLADAPRRAAAVVAFEARLAALQSTSAELVAEQSRPWPARPVATLRQRAPSIDWERYFAAQGPQLPGRIIVPPSHMRDLDALLRRTDIGVLRDYLRWQLLHALATSLPPVFEIEHNRMYDPAAAVAGRTASCVRHVDDGFGPTLGAHTSSATSRPATASGFRSWPGSCARPCAPRSSAPPGSTRPHAPRCSPTSIPLRPRSPSRTCGPTRWRACPRRPTFSPPRWRYAWPGSPPVTPRPPAAPGRPWPPPRSTGRCGATSSSCSPE